MIATEMSIKPCVFETAGPTSLVTGGGTDLVPLTITPTSGYNLSINAGVPDGGTTGDYLSVLDSSGTSVVRNVPAGAGSGMVQVLYAGGKTSTITYFGFEQVATLPVAS